MQTRIVFLDDNEDLRVLLPLMVGSALDVHAVSFGSLAEMQQERETVLQSDVAILDINLGPGMPDGIDAFHWLRDQGFRGKILFLTGHARANPQVAKAVVSGAEILEKPLHPDQLIASIQRVLHEAA